MAQIRVFRPFYLNTVPGSPARLFAPGVHTLTEAEVGHWYVRACVKDGLAEDMAAPVTEAPKAEDAPVAEPETPVDETTPDTTPEAVSDEPVAVDATVQDAEATPVTAKKKGK